MIVGWLLACTVGGEPVSVREAFDVPPPPETRTLEIELSWAPALGSELVLAGPATVHLDVVDVRGAGPYTVTGYVPEDEADLALSTSGWRARR